jgi:molybdate transport system substrate-binding protein
MAAGDGDDEAAVRPRRLLLIAAVVAVAVLTIALATTRGGGAPAGGAQVLAAASVADAVADADPRARVQAGGSDQLAFQVENGITADVIVSADAAITRRLHDEGHAGRPVPVAGNRLVVITPAENPAGITGVRDLARPGLRLVVGTPSVPVGAYTRQALMAMGLGDATANVVSEEPDVRGVVAKVALGEADAGIVYATDAAAAGARVATLAIPSTVQPAIVYTAAVLTRSTDPDAGRDLIALMRSADGRRALAARGFTVPVP